MPPSIFDKQVDKIESLVLRRRCDTSTSIRHFDVDQTLRRRSNASTSIRYFDVDQVLRRRQDTSRWNDLDEANVYLLIMIYGLGLINDERFVYML